MDYILEEIPRGQLNNVILTTMLDGDKYGYEIIDEILSWSNGKIELKQPSLYSALTRLEKADMLSSYWTDSDIGGKRHYYRLTDLGRKTATAWAEDFMQEKSAPSPKKEVKIEEEKKESFTILDQGNIFQLINKPEKEEIKEEVKKEETNELQFNLFDQIPVKQEIKEEKIVKAARIANANSNLVQLKQYSEADRKLEFERLKQNRQAFFAETKAEEKTEMKAEAPTPTYSFISNEPKKEEKVEIKPAINEIVKEPKIEETFNISKYASARDGYFLEPDSKIEDEKTEEIKETVVRNEYVKPDAIFLSEYERIEHLPEVKKIEPMNLNIEFANPNESISFKKNYPSDLLATKKVEEKPAEETAPKSAISHPSFSSYLGLKNYYSHLGIGFNEYKKLDKSEVVDKKQIWLTNLLRCSTLLLISIILALGLNFGITSNLYGRIGFIIFPAIITLIDVIYLGFYLDARKNPKTKAKVLNLTSTAHTLIAAACVVIVLVAINLMMGLGNETALFIPTLVYPVVLLTITAFAPLINKVINKILIKIKK